MRKLLMPVVIFLTLALISCFGPQARTIPRDFGMQKAEVRDKIPLRAGLYLTPGFKIFIQGLLGGTSQAYVTLSMGDALEGGSIQALKNIFKEVVLIDGMDGPEPLKGKIDVLVTPEVVNVDVKMDPYPIRVNG